MNKADKQKVLGMFQKAVKKLGGKFGFEQRANDITVIVKFPDEDKRREASLVCRGHDTIQNAFKQTWKALGLDTRKAPGPTHPPEAEAPGFAADGMFNFQPA